MPRFTSSLVAILAVLGLVLFAPTVNADSSEKITRYDTTVHLDAKGTAQVKVDFDYDYGSNRRHGPVVALVERQAMDNDPDHWRVIDISDVQVTSPNAPADVDLKHDDGVLLIRVGDEDKYVSGQKSYTLTYRVRGLIAPNHSQSGLDEFNFNAVGNQWQVPILNPTATVTGPVGVQRASCFFGADYGTPCEGEATQATATFKAGALRSYQGMQITAGFPAGTFTDAGPSYERRYTQENTFAVNPATVGTGGVVTVAGLIVVVGNWLRRRRDEVYVGLTPGLSPAPGANQPTELAWKRPPATVQFTPPKDTIPGEVGVLLDGSADEVDVTATILDLAGRGYFRIVEEEAGTWRFERLIVDTNQLTSAESNVVTTLFQRGHSVTTEELRDKQYSGLMSQTKTDLDTSVVQRGWFRDVKGQRLRLLVLSAALLFGGALLTFWLAVTIGWGLAALPLCVVGVVGGVLAMLGRGRSAEGSAVLAQAEGFKLYLSTAEADQIRFEEGIDVFSRYLPYATVFGVADRWAKVFEQLAAQGRYTAPDWYVGYYGFSMMNFSSALGGLSGGIGSAMASSVAANTATNASSGGSGFSGGGGFGGGGGGSW